MLILPEDYIFRKKKIDRKETNADTIMINTMKNPKLGDKRISSSNIAFQLCIISESMTRHKVYGLNLSDCLNSDVLHFSYV